MQQGSCHEGPAKRPPPERQSALCRADSAWRSTMSRARGVLLLIGCAMVLGIVRADLLNAVYLNVGNVHLSRAVAAGGAVGKELKAERAVCLLQIPNVGHFSPRLSRNLVVAHVAAADVGAAVDDYVRHQDLLEDDHVVRRYADVLVRELYDRALNAEDAAPQSYRAMLSLDPFNLYAYEALVRSGHASSPDIREFPAVLDRSAGGWIQGTVEYRGGQDGSWVAICDGSCDAYLHRLNGAGSDDDRFIVVKEAETWARRPYYKRMAEGRAVWVGDESWRVYLPRRGGPYSLWLRYFDNGRRSITVHWQGQSVTLPPSEGWDWAKVAEITGSPVEIVFRGTGDVPGVIDKMLITNSPGYEPTGLDGTR